MQTKVAKDIDEYIARFPDNVQKMLRKIRTTIRKAAPQAKEAISYQMPTFKLNGNLIHFAAYKNHIGLYPTPRAIEHFKKQLARYEGSKGAIRLPLDEPVPVDLISDIVKFRVNMNLEKTKKQ